MGKFRTGLTGDHIHLQSPRPNSASSGERKPKAPRREMSASPQGQAEPSVRFDCEARDLEETDIPGQQTLDVSDRYCRGE
jgi:hypothetical protein